MRCKHYTAGTYTVLNCTRAHSDDGFPETSLEPRHHITQLAEAAPYVLPSLTKK